MKANKNDEVVDKHRELLNRHDNLDYVYDDGGRSKSPLGSMLIADANDSIIRAIAIATGENYERIACDLLACKNRNQYYKKNWEIQHANPHRDLDPKAQYKPPQAFAAEFRSDRWSKFLLDKGFREYHLVPTPDEPNKGNKPSEMRPDHLPKGTIIAIQICRGKFFRMSCVIDHVVHDAVDTRWMPTWSEVPRLSEKRTSGIQEGIWEEIQSVQFDGMIPSRVASYWTHET